MGFLDCLAGIMQIFAATYLPGSLLILLLQSAIPISMALSSCFLGATYHVTQYVAATIVCAGIILVLAPSLFGGGDDGGGNTVSSR
jgi:drug/metabolite transporter (DMT)-like permease